MSLSSNQVSIVRYENQTICINLGSSNENGVYFINCTSKLQKMAYFVSFFV